jgi:hypothetical protein
MMYTTRAGVHLGHAVGIASRLHQHPIAVELPRRAPRVGEDEQRPNLVAVRGVERRVRRAVILVDLHSHTVTQMSKNHL